MAHSISITDELITPPVAREETEGAKDAGDETLSEEKFTETSKNDPKEDAQMGLSEINSKYIFILSFISNQIQVSF